MKLRIETDDYGFCVMDEFNLVLDYNKRIFHVYYDYKKYDYLKIHNQKYSNEEALQLARAFIKNLEMAVVFG